MLSFKEYLAEDKDGRSCFRTNESPTIGHKKLMEKIVSVAKKVAQVAAYLLWKNGGKMDQKKLMTLLYLSEREFLTKYGEELTGDTILATPEGIVLQHTNELMKHVQKHQKIA